MIRKQLLFALRRLGRHKLTTTLNVLGLSVGILSCLVIYLYVAFEWSFDRFHPDSNRIYRVVLAKTGAGGMQDNDGAAMAGAVGVTMGREINGLSAVSTLFTRDSRVIIPQAGQQDRIIARVGDDQPYHISVADPD